MSLSLLNYEQLEAITGACTPPYLFVRRVSLRYSDAHLDFRSLTRTLFRILFQ